MAAQSRRQSLRGVVGVAAATVTRGAGVCRITAGEWLGETCRGRIRHGLRGGDGIADRHEHPQEHVCDDAGPERESGRGERESHQPYGRSQM